MDNLIQYITDTFHNTKEKFFGHPGGAYYPQNTHDKYSYEEYLQSETYMEYKDSWIEYCKKKTPPCKKCGCIKYLHHTNNRV